MKLIHMTAFFTLMAAPAMAADMATRAQITDQIIGNTVSGGMSSGEAYAEFYTTDGAIKADGYTGKWSLEGDEMCFDYGEGVDCFGVGLDGANVTWFSGGEEAGTGTITAGNPNDF
ncbi:MAG: hypothetical protein AAF231_06850 [Pseudomonadota bacterium]